MICYRNGMENINYAINKSMVYNNIEEGKNIFFFITTHPRGNHGNHIRFTCHSINESSY